MKTSITLFAIAALMSLATFCNATVRYLNNQEPRPNGPGTMHYTDWTSVHTAANPGDTIYMEGSAVNYGSLTVTVSSLTILGPGFNTTTFSGLEAMTGSITVNAGVTGVKVIGLHLVGGILWYNNGSNNITVKRCRLLAVVNLNNPATISGLTVEECYMDGWLNGNDLLVLRNQDSGSIISNLTFRNNLCNGGWFFFNGGNATTSVVSNNVFVLQPSAGNDAVQNVINTSFVNNIFLTNDGTPFTGNQSGNWYNNNIMYPSTAAFPASGGTNYPATNPVMVNQPVPPTTINYSPQDYHLTVGSPAVAKGPDGLPNTADDMGLYGGVNYYTMTGDPAIPIITQFQITNPTVNLGDNLNLNMTIVRNQ